MLSLYYVGKFTNLAKKLRFWKAVYFNVSLSKIAFPTSRRSKIRVLVTRHWTAICQFCFKDEGLNFISENFNDRYLFLKWRHVTPLTSTFSPRYFPFRLEWWQLSYLQAPPLHKEQWPLLHISLSLSFMVNALFLCNANESPLSLNMNPLQVDTSPAHYQCKTCHI